MRPPSMRQTASTARRMSVTVRPSVRLGACGQLLAPAGFLLDVLVVGVVGEGLLVARDLAHLELGPRAKRSTTRPLCGLLLAGDLDDPEPVEQLVGLAVGAVGDDRFLRREVDDEAFFRVGE